jgi:arginine-tRNA-protein transferase
MALHDSGVYRVMPLRLDLRRFALSRSQKRVLARNRDLEVVVRASSITDEKEELFFKHRERCREHVPTSLYDFFSE